MSDRSDYILTHEADKLVAELREQTTERPQK